ncbi:monooxygenase flavin-binding family protein-like protein [Xylogone sp. PMI_703]|nr:monooxygenase flavin-binding family protein-like protein [Xylogone sp. PMI_703]
MGSIDRSIDADFDVVIVGAGISGINTAYRLQTEIPGIKYTILEARGAVGGTWDLFRYPGIRSDSDLYTFGLAWFPWTENEGIVAGPKIRKYLNNAISKHGIDKQIKFHHKVETADWSSKERSWIFSVDANGEKKVIRSRWYVAASGYYDYHEPYKAEIPGLQNFKGTILHPQSWPEDLDYKDKKMIIVGSGATAITLLPSLAQTAARVTMVQRSPTYIISVPGRDRLAERVRKIFPAWVSAKFDRWKNFLIPQLFYYFCQKWPQSARNFLTKMAQKQLPKDIPVDPHFTPRYNPWEQRLCTAPSGDFYKALRKGNADIVTGSIKTVTETGIIMEDGKEIEGDFIITATGLKVRVGGGTRISIDGQPLNVADKFVWRTMMLQDVPNAAFVIGYSNASWTLGADVNAHFLFRIIRYMRSRNFSTVTPRLKEEEKAMKTLPVLKLNSGYLLRATNAIPKAGDVGPWRGRDNYLIDLWTAKWGSITDHLEYTEATDKKNE